MTRVPTIGLLYPGVGAEDDFPRLEQRLAGQLRLPVVTTAGGDVLHTVDTLLSVGSSANLLEGARRAAAYQPDAVMWACTSGSFVYGWEGAQEQARRIGEDLGLPASSTSLAFAHAVKHLGLSSVAIAASYPEDLARHFRRFLADASIDVVYLGSSGIATAGEVGLMGLDEIARMAAAADRPEARVVFTAHSIPVAMAGPGFSQLKHPARRARARHPRQMRSGPGPTRPIHAPGRHQILHHGQRPAPRTAFQFSNRRTRDRPTSGGIRLRSLELEHSPQPMPGCGFRREGGILAELVGGAPLHREASMRACKPSYVNQAGMYRADAHPSALRWLVIERSRRRNCRRSALVQLRGGPVRRPVGTVVWNGPMGVFETPPFNHGTLAIARAMAHGVRDRLGVRKRRAPAGCWAGTGRGGGHRAAVAVGLWAGGMFARVGG